MLRSRILSGNPRLENAAVGGPSVKRRPPDDDFDAVQRIQRALREIGYTMSLSFKTGDADGKFGDETFRAVQDFQRHAFPDQPGQWDGRVGRNTLAQMDNALSSDDETVDGPAEERIASVSTVDPSKFG